MALLAFRRGSSSQPGIDQQDTAPSHHAHILQRLPLLDAGIYRCQILAPHQIDPIAPVPAMAVQVAQVPRPGAQTPPPRRPKWKLSLTLTPLRRCEGSTALAVTGGRSSLPPSGFWLWPPCSRDASWALLRCRVSAARGCFGCHLFPCWWW